MSDKPEIIPLPIAIHDTINSIESLQASIASVVPLRELQTKPSIWSGIDINLSYTRALLLEGLALFED